MNHHNGNPLLPYQSTTFPGGLTLIHKEIRTAPIVAIDIWVHTGAIHDPHPHYGLSHFFEHMFFKGTKLYGVGEMDRIITSLGGYNNAATSLDYTHYYVVLPSFGWRKAMNVMLDSLFQPLFDPEEIEKERSVIVEEIKRHEDNPWSKSYDEFTQIAFSPNRYQRQVLGTVESLDTIDQSVFQAYHQTQYAPDNVTISTAGDVSYQEIEEVISLYVDEYQHSSGERINLDQEGWNVLDTTAEVTMRRDVNQCYLLLGYPTPKITDIHEIMALSCLSTIAGEGRASRLYRRLNDELGIVSSLGCSFIRLKYAGLYLVEAVTDMDKLEQVEDEIDRETTKLMNSITEEELQRAKSIERADFAFGNEKAVSIAHIFGYGNAVTSIDEALNYLTYFESVTIDDMITAAEKYLIPQRRCKGLLIPNA